jgi:hypothetical protein
LLIQKEDENSSLVAMKEPGATSRKPVVLGAGDGRSYPMGRIAALFKADGAETESRYSISEWWLDPHTQGPGLICIPRTTSFTLSKEP